MKSNLIIWEMTYMNNIENSYHQKATIEYLKNTYGKELWVQVAGHKELNGADACFWSAVVNLSDLVNVYKDSCWDSRIGTQAPQLVEYGNGNVQYEKNSSFEVYYENIVNLREFYGIKPNYVEISEEFRLLNNLYHDTKSNIFYFVNDNGSLEEVARIENNSDVLIKLKYLIKYVTAKQMALLLFFDIRQEITGTLEENQLKKFSNKYIEKDIVYSIWGDEMIGHNYIYSILMGKKIIMPKPINECGYWPYEKEYEYLDFIVGTDEFGENKYFTSNPDELANYFGANPDAPDYLTPVFFKKEVLQKYLSHPDIYSIEDGYLRCCGLWGLRMDNHHKDYVSVYLGDLGQELPCEEQPHWKNFNIVSDKSISDVKFKRDFLGIPTNAEISDLKFKADFSYFQKQWYNKFGWYLFLPLNSDDEYNFNKIHIPILNTQDEFDHLVLSLVKTIIDSINEKEIKKLLKDGSDKNSGKELKGSISKLERWFEESNLIDYAVHVEFLRNLQNLRSSGTGHRKGSNYNKVSKEFNLDSESFANVFDSILEKTNMFLSYLTNIFLV